MIDTDKLRGRMAEKRITGKALSKAIGMTQNTFVKKMQKGVFGSDEIDKMIDILEIENPCEFFFVKP